MTKTLSVALAILSLIATGCKAKYARTQGPSSIQQFPSDLSDSRLELAGIYADGWTAPTSSFNLFQPDGRQVLTIRGMIPKIDRDDFKTEVDVLWDDKVVARKSVGLGNFSVQAHVPPSPGKHRIGIGFTSVQLLPAGDGRPIGTRLSFAGFEPDDSSPSIGADIVSNGAAIHLGSGWHSLEAQGRFSSRIADNDAQLMVSPAERATRRVVLVMESASDPDKPVVLRVLDSSGRQVDAAEVSKHSTVDIFLPVQTGPDNDFRLRLDGNHGPAFRVYRIETF
jgi:hypothetical protein